MHVRVFPFGLIMALGIGLLVLMLFLALSLGSMHIPIAQSLAIFLHKTNLYHVAVDGAWKPAQEAIVWQIRLPRAILAGLVGGGLAIVGACLQAVTRNPLAEPHLLGISSGAAFGAIAALLHTGLFLGGMTVPLMAFAGGMLATLLVLGIMRFSARHGADRLVHTGVAVSFAMMALANLLIYLGDPRASHTVVFWMLGGFGLAQWSQLIYPALVLLVCGGYLLFRSRQMTAMTLGDETASTMGIEVSKFRLSVFVVSALITGVMVSFSGMIGFVGLVVPHFLRLLFGGSYLRLLPSCLLFGAIFMIGCDVLARILLAPDDMPVGILTGIIGGGMFIWLLRK
ncbi:FecCD family ABC transporter permease [Polycladidibacter stylochi]|uniref:FecCD family ABC transporter permease n=1 Tax=Polycladidibacter stylochi TaxID=1807766 RepID=UPI000834077D|nr:iron ABC transporter permease [Pseudovibrio stylochi]